MIEPPYEAANRPVEAKRVLDEHEGTARELPLTYAPARIPAIKRWLASDNPLDRKNGCDALFELPSPTAPRRSASIRRPW